MGTPSIITDHPPDLDPLTNPTRALEDQDILTYPPMHPITTRHQMCPPSIMTPREEHSAPRHHRFSQFAFSHSFVVVEIQITRPAVLGTRAVHK